jgi:hypothetical protein
MEKITASQFGKFEGFELMNSHMVKGGMLPDDAGGTATGGGWFTQSYEKRDGVWCQVVTEWDGDTRDSNGGVAYNHYTTTWRRV